MALSKDRFNLISLFLIKKAMKTSYVYILKCADNSYYTGVTSNLEQRICEHQSGYLKESYTSTRLPVTLVYYVQFMDVKQAIAYEKQLKGWTRKKKEAIINDNWDKLKELARCMNETSHKNYLPFDSAPLDLY